MHAGWVPDGRENIIVLTIRLVSVSIPWISCYRRGAARIIEVNIKTETNRITMEHCCSIRRNLPKKLRNGNTLILFRR